jgi:ribosome biogenesis GTPase
VSAPLERGLVLRTDAKVCHVEVGARVVQAAPRGILYGEDGTKRLQKNPVAVGDIVEVDLSSNPASLENVQPRRNWLSRTASSHDPREQVLAANVDQLLVVTSLGKPGFSSNRTDRILAACEWGRIPARILLNKIDLAEEDEVESLMETYALAKVPILPTCALDGRGLDELRELVRGKATVFYGASGAGKSSLLNSLQPALKLKVGKISKFWDAGRHTTSFSQMITLEPGTRVIDTPGIRTFRLYGITAQDLRGLFPEFQAFQSKCGYMSCTHDHEPVCAVFDAVESGEIAASRYASYVEMLDELRTPSADEGVEDAEPEPE